jgi:hypothetical protein
MLFFELVNYSIYINSGDLGDDLFSFWHGAFNYAFLILLRRLECQKVGEVFLLFLKDILPLNSESDLENTPTCALNFEWFITKYMFVF